MNYNTKSKSGFTIIEVVLVLAIAGLIFLIVFLAVPALQRSQRDTQRRNDSARFMSQISNFQSNNKGVVPTVATGAAAVGATPTVGDFIAAYLDNGSGTPDNWKDPSSGSVYPRVAAVGDVPTTSGQWNYYVGQICNGEAATTTGASARNVAFVMKLEGAGSFCATNK